jgi:DNA-binding PucR family transcriptional regulator
VKEQLELRDAEVELRLEGGQRHEEGAGEERLVVADDELAQLIVHGDRSLVEELAGSRLAPLSGRSKHSRARLQETLAAWLDHQGNVPETARALHVHPQTVRYRLAQLRELFGDRLDDPQARFELSLAVRASPG